MHNKASLFKGARNIVVKDSPLTVNVDTTSKEGKLDRLLEEVAPNAILNAGGRADEVRCYPGTREEVIEKIENWMDGEGEQNHRMMWLSGPAGSGKSAIAQTAAEHCQERGIHAANFFFFRGDVTRNHAQPLVPTLVYQLLRLNPALNDLLVDCLTATPFAYKASTQEQFLQLISSPIQMIHRSSLIHQPIILILDGLDECENGERDQEKILKALYALVELNDSPFRVLVASRAEPHLVMSFNKIGSSVESIFLDDQYRPQDDIRRFVVAKFDEIKRVHHLAHTVDEQWPEAADIDAITHKSSGQFIYAATVMRFIEYSSASPAISLLTVHGVRPATDHSPLSQLDAVYSYIFSKASDLHNVKLLLGAHLLTIESSLISFQYLMECGGYEAVDVESFIADLAPIFRFSLGPPMQLIFYHASLSDYLADESRSAIYYVGVAAVAAEWASICMRKTVDFSAWKVNIHILSFVRVATPELSKSLLDASRQNLPTIDPWESTMYRHRWISLMIDIYTLYFETDRALFNRMLRCWIHFAYIHNIKMVPAFIGTFYFGTMTRHIYMHYNWYLLTEGVKSALKPRTEQKQVIQRLNH